MGNMVGQYNDNDDITIKGGTDSTVIGNVSDRLKVDASFSSPPTISETELATFITLSRATATAQNKSMISLLNAGGSTVVIKIREIWIVNEQNTAVTGTIANFELRRITNHSAGTTLTPLSHDTNDSLNSSVTARTGSTVSGESASLLRRWEWSTDEWAQGAQDVESNDHALQSLTPSYLQSLKTKPLTLRAGEGITIKQTVNTTTGSFDLIIVFTQE